MPAGPKAATSLAHGSFRKVSMNICQRPLVNAPAVCEGGEAGVVSMVALLGTRNAQQGRLRTYLYGGCSFEREQFWHVNSCRAVLWPTHSYNTSNTRAQSIIAQHYDAEFAG